MAAYKVSVAQLRYIFRLKNEIGMDIEDLHAIAYRIGGVESLKNLTAREAARMIDELKRRAGEPVETSVSGAPSKATGPQKNKILALTREMGWADQPERLRGYLRRMCGAEELRFLTPQQASCVIDGLKAMRDGGRAERKREVIG